MNRFMKRMVLTLAAAVVALSASAEYVEVVHLKNGSVIKGTIIEQIPNKTIKIKTKDDSIFVYPVAEVTKITKEEVAPAPQQQYNGYNQQGGYNPQAQNQNYSQVPNFAVEKEEEEHGWNNAVRYRGFLTEDFGFGDFDFSTFSTSHGVQLSDYIFLGAGLGYTYAEEKTYSDKYGYDYKSAVGVTLFAHVRSEIHKAFKSNVSPYAELKLGYDTTFKDGLCCLFGSGCHFYFGHSNAGASVGLVYNSHGAFGFSLGLDW